LTQKSFQGWKKKGLVGTFHSGVYDVDNKDIVYYGGEHGLRFYEIICDLCCSALLKYSRQHGSPRELPLPEARVLEFIYIIAHSILPNTKPEKLTPLIKNWCESFRKPMGDEFCLIMKSDSMITRMKEYEETLSNDLFSFSDQLNSWEDFLSNMQRELAKLYPRIEKQIPAIEKFLPLYQWIFRRLCHNNFSRFYFNGFEEYVLTLVFSDILSQGKISSKLMVA